MDARLFGLGRERYTQLLDLLIALRRPLLAKDLDPVKVSETLTAGLSPVDDDLVEQAARDFENLAAVQKQYDDLAAADAAVRAFLDQYIAYLRVHARHQADQVAARIRRPPVTSERSSTAVHGSSRGRAAGTARPGKRRADARSSVRHLRRPPVALKNRDAYKDHEKLALRRSQLEKDKTRLAAGPGTAGLGPGQRLRPAAEADAVAQTGWPSWAGPRPARRRLAEAADRRGPHRDGSSPPIPAPTWPPRPRPGSPPAATTSARSATISPWSAMRNGTGSAPRPTRQGPAGVDACDRPAGRPSKGWPPPARRWPGSSAAGPPGGSGTSPTPPSPPSQAGTLCRRAGPDRRAGRSQAHRDCSPTLTGRAPTA